MYSSTLWCEYRNNESILNISLDAVSVQLMLDDLMSQEVDDLQPHKSVFDMAKPRNVSGVISIPKPVISSINNWYHSTDEKHDFSSMREFLV